MQTKKEKTNTAPTPKLTVHGSNRVRWYFQCSHQWISWPMLVKAWFANNIVLQTIKHKRYNNEDKHTLILNSSTKKKKDKVHDMHYVDLSWCCATLCADVKHMHSLNYHMQAQGPRRPKPTDERLKTWKGECMVKLSANKSEW